MADRRFRLREETAKAHAELEAQAGALETLSAYRRLLHGLHAGRAPLETALARADWPATFGAWRPMPIAALIADDLHDLGEPIPLPAPEPRIESEADIFGILYVLEGSSLGARVVYRHAQALGMHAQFGARHLAAQSAGNSWKAFIGLLEEAPGLDMDATIRAACETFDLMRRAMSGHAHA